jgi:hypothetical protein
VELRTEIIESEKARADLLKWKIILAAAIGGAGLGLGSSAVGANYYLFCLIPLVCVYVDILCSHMNLRIMVIGRFLLMNFHAGIENPTEVRYESFVEKARAMPVSQPSASPGGISAFAFEGFAQHFSTAVLSISVIAWGIWGRLRLIPEEQWPFYAAGSIGLAASVWGYLAYRQRLRSLTALAQRELQEYVRHSAPVSAPASDAVIAQPTPATEV